MHALPVQTACVDRTGRRVHDPAGNRLLKNLSRPLGI
jgi:hypothetical protein